MIALLDANLLIDAGKTRLVARLVEAAKTCPWRITQEVFDELDNVPGRAHLQPLVRPSPVLGTPEAQLAAAIVTGGHWGALGVGEAASIAAASVDPMLRFVTWDIKAGWRSLHELRGRTSVGHAWLRELVDDGRLTSAEADAIARADTTRRHPTWW